MSEQMTTIQIPGADGWMLYGRRTRQEMISNYRAMAERKKFRLEKVLSAKDEDFIVMQHTGKCVKRNRVLLPHSSGAQRRTNALGERCAVAHTLHPIVGNSELEVR